MISLAKKISYRRSANHNSELRCVICTGDTLFALAFHLNCTALSQPESSNFFMHIIRGVNQEFRSYCTETIQDKTSRFLLSLNSINESSALFQARFLCVTSSDIQRDV